VDARGRGYIWGTWIEEYGVTASDLVALDNRRSSDLINQVTYRLLCWTDRCGRSARVHDSRNDHQFLGNEKVIIFCEPTHAVNSGPAISYGVGSRKWCKKTESKLANLPANEDANESIIYCTSRRIRTCG
jgi:hypothetical protein